MLYVPRASVGKVMRTPASEPSAVETALPLAVETVRIIPMTASEPFSPVTVMVIGSFAEKVAGSHAKSVVPPGVAVAGVAVHDPDGG
ncbi:hypothetical protein GCM10009532_13670 [Microbacterium aurantiacum]